MSIRFPVANPTLGEKERAYVRDCIDSHWISSSGPYIEKFEALFSKNFLSPFSLCTNSGTMAIEIALAALGISQGDEVLVPNLTFVGSVSPIYRQQAIPVLVPTAKDSWNMETKNLEKYLSPKTKAIVVVHLYGMPCDMKTIMEFASKNSLFVIEDCAESLGAKINGQYVGTFGEVGCFSFFGNKVLTTGEGGMCISSDKKIHERMNLYRDHGMRKDERYWHRVIGYNGRMTNLQAAVGLGQLEDLSGILKKRKWIHDIYESHFAGKEYFYQIKTPEGSEGVTWLESRVLSPSLGLDRDQLMVDLAKDGIDSRPFFFPVSAMPAFSRFGFNDENSMRVASHGFNLPTYTTLEEDHIHEIAEKVCGHLEKQVSNHSKDTLKPHYPEDHQSLAEPDVSVILPTYNEGESLLKIVEHLRQEFVRMSMDYEILIEDDGVDGSAEQVQQRFSADSRVKVNLHKKRLGLGASILRGLVRAKGVYVVVMDSNGNHDPKMVGAVVRLAESYDLVVGSRFSPGGGMRSRIKWLGSYTLNLWIKVVLGLKTRDNLSGFFCTRRDRLNQCETEHIFKKSGDYFIRLMFQIQKRETLRIVELPVQYLEKKGRGGARQFGLFWRYFTETCKERFKS